MRGWERLARELAAALKQRDEMENDDTELRLECLRLANGFGEGPRDIVERAEAYLAFLKGASAGSARDKINAELDKAGVI